MTEYGPKGLSARHTSHSGALRREYRQARRRVTVMAAAEKPCRPDQMPQAILPAHAFAPRATGARSGRLTGDETDIRLGMQMAHNLWRAHRDLGETVTHLRAPRTLPGRRRD